MARKPDGYDEALAELQTEGERIETQHALPTTVSLSDEPCPVTERIAPEISKDPSMDVLNLNRVGCFAASQVCKRAAFHVGCVANLTKFFEGETAAETQRRTKSVLGTYQTMAEELRSEAERAGRLLIDGFPPEDANKVNCSMATRAQEQMKDVVGAIDEYALGPLRRFRKPSRVLEKLEQGARTLRARMTRVRAATDYVREQALRGVVSPLSPCPYHLPP